MVVGLDAARAKAIGQVGAARDCDQVAMTVHQVLIACTCERICECPEHGPARAPVAGGRVPLGHTHLDRPAPCMVDDHPADRGQVGFHARQVGTIVVMGRDETDQIARPCENAGCWIRRKKLDTLGRPSSSPGKTPAGSARIRRLGARWRLASSGRDRARDDHSWFAWPPSACRRRH